MKTHSEAVTESRKRTKARAVNVSMKPDESALLDRMADEHGGIKAAIVAGLRALERRNEPTNDELLEMMRRRMERD
jgi:hypothetical protein